MRLRRFLAISTAIATASTVQIPAQAATDNSELVINEVYGGGGNKDAAFNRDFIELYNPSEKALSLDGVVAEYFSATGGSGGTVSLDGELPAGAHYLIGQGFGNNTDLPALPEVDAEGTVAISATKGRVVLSRDGAQIDAVSWGASTPTEGDPAGATTNATSVSRADGADTDNNATDFTVGAPSPTNSGNTAPAPAPGVAGPARGVAIAEIQGSGDMSPLDGERVTTEGVVTASYPDGGKNGFVIQTAGTGAEIGEASHAIFVYLGSAASTAPKIGENVSVTGTVAEFHGSTQLTNVEVSPTERTGEVTPLAIDILPTEREPLEHMLIKPGAHTVTNNYQLNRFGEVGLNGGDEPLYQPTDIVLPGEEAQKLQAANDARLVLLDDGRTPAYDKNPEVPLPYIAVDGQVHKSLRTGDTVTFQHPVVLDYGFDAWRFQPTTPITGDSSAAELPITWEDSRATEITAVDNVAGDYHLASFNVLNYFTSLGEEEDGCQAYTDINGDPVTANRCTVRGAYSQAAFNDQQAKIVNAINALDTDVVALSEIENTAAVSGDPARRDEALAHLVDKLNEAAGTDRWAYVASPATVGEDEDVIRLAFIYNPATVKPEGESRIFNDAAFTGTVRQPLAQKFVTVDGSGSFVAVNNHFKSKGSVVRGDDDQGDGQGNNPNVRNDQALALLKHLGEQQDWVNEPTFIVGDLNSYSKEDTLRTIEAEGYTNLGDEPTYQFDGQLGSLDHALANDAARALVTDAKVWNINADEPIAFQYSRRNYNAVDFYDYSPFASSDHDPIKVGFSFSNEQPQPDTGSSHGGKIAAIVLGIFGGLGIFAFLIPRILEFFR